VNFHDGSTARFGIPLAAASVILLGGAATLLPSGAAVRHYIWMTGLLLTAAPIVWNTGRGILRRKFAADLIASLTVIVALTLGQPVVGLVIVIMQSGGESLERLAGRRASDALRALQENAPRVVHRFVNDALEDIGISTMVAGDLILVRPGEMVPCDGEVINGSSHVDTSTLTGEPLPRKVSPGSALMSGCINLEGPLTVRAVAAAEESQYAKIVALVREAQASKAPLQRVADRFAAWFTPLTIVVCGIGFAISGDWERVLAVLAIATPCPLILATPVAILGGMNTSARRQILIRNGAALEALGRTTAVIFDKTGTITIGHPQVTRVVAVSEISEDQVLKLASAVEQGSGHLLARTLVKEAEKRGLLARPATGVVEAAGRGVEGESDGMHVAVGARSYITEKFPATKAAIARLDEADGESATLRAYVSVNGDLVGLVEYGDVIRSGIAELVRSLREAGVRHLMLLSGDRAENARAVARKVGIDEARGDMLPEDKVAIVKRLLHSGESVVMIGDGTNDAPALGTATVGVALASHGRGIATEAADVILLADDPSRLLDGIKISRRTMRIARQSIWVGLCISGIGMMFAATGKIPPIAGAGLQELVDLGVILNALRVSRPIQCGKRREILQPILTDPAFQRS
jgi:heavy metal translocating P-type ATPase